MSSVPVEQHASFPQPVEDADRLCYRAIERLAHELKNPLTPILSAAQMLQRHGASKPEVVDWAGVSIEREVRKMNAVLGELLDFSRAMLGRIELQPTALNLQPVLVRVAAACRGAAVERNHTLHSELPADPLWVAADETRLEQVLEQLLLNAVKFTPAGGMIKLTAALEDGKAVIRVSDNGPGLDPSVLDKVFTPFFDVYGAGGIKARGMGIGLALASRLIALQSGTLRASNAGSGCGTEFVIHLPAIQPPAAGSEPQRTGAMPAAGAADMSLGSC